MLRLPRMENVSLVCAPIFWLYLLAEFYGDQTDTLAHRQETQQRTNTRVIQRTPYSTSSQPSHPPNNEHDH